MGGSSHKGNTQRTFEVEKLSGKKCHERKNIQDEVICVEEEGKAEGSKEDDLDQAAAAVDKAATLAAAAAVEKAGIAEHMDKAAKLIDEILEEIMRELFAEQVRG